MFRVHDRRRPPIRPVLEGLEERCVPAGSFQQTNLVSDLPGLAAVMDANLVNPWGIAQNPAGPFWLADNGTGVSTLYDATGKPQSAGASLAVTLPVPPGSPAGTVAQPTGIVFNGGTGFTVSANGVSGPAEFLFASEDGTISGWNPTVDPTHAILAVNNSIYGGSGSSAVYKALAIGTNSTGTFLFAADFQNGIINVYDQNFNRVQLAGNFSDPTIPAGFVPFNVKNVGGKLFVEYARQDNTPTGGFVNEFDTNGMLIKRIASQGPLNAPWGVTLAPAQFGAFSNDLLVGNFGDGRINAFDPNTGAFMGQLTDSTGAPITNDHLWALTFGNGAGGSDRNTLYFAAGIQNETHGLFGSIRPAADSALNQRLVTQLYTDLLHRSVDPQGLAFWTGMLNSGGTATQVALGIESSTENRTNEVQALYHRLLGRDADPMGMSFWLNFMAGGHTIQDVESGIFGSDEYFTRHGGTAGGFLQGLYQDVLHRSVDPLGQQVWGPSITDIAHRTAVASEVLASQESAQDEVQALFGQLLHRTADPQGLGFFGGELKGGVSLEMVTAMIAGSAEYQSRV